MASNTNLNDTTLKKRRSSILKQRNPLDDEQDFTECLTEKFNIPKRVSFARSNSIKPFVADSEKNTIWDTTYEENVKESGSISSQPSLEKASTLSKATLNIFCLDEESIEKPTPSQLKFQYPSQISFDENCLDISQPDSMNSKLNTTSFFVSNDSILNESEIGQPLASGTQVNIEDQIKVLKSKMEKKPSVQIKKQNTILIDGSIDISVDEYNKLCQQSHLDIDNISLIAAGEMKEGIRDSSLSHFLVQNKENLAPGLNYEKQKLGLRSEPEPLQGSVTSKDSKCFLENKENIYKGLVGPSLMKENEQKEDFGNNSNEGMEFTCILPEGNESFSKQKENVKGLNRTQGLDGMEFTCNIPVNIQEVRRGTDVEMLNLKESGKIQESFNKTSGGEGMEFTCIQSNVSNCFNRQNVGENGQENQKDCGMEFTCVLPVPVADSKSNVSLKLKESFDLKKEMEISSVSKPLEDKNPKETENLIEIESKQPTKFSLNKTVGVAGMEFTCVLPVEAKIGSDLENVQLASKPVHFSNEKELITKVQVENKTPILFCEQEKENPQKIPNDLLLKGTEFTSVKQSLKLNSTSAENQETLSFVERTHREKLAEEEGMEFTCALPVPVADSKSNVSLKTKEPFDDKKKIEMEKSSSVSKPLWDKNLKETGFLEKENVIETKSEQQTKLSLNRTVGVEGMEFTCVLPIETKIDSELDNIQLASKSIHFSNEKELINKIPVENQTPILFCEQEKENPQKIHNDFLSKGMEFTSVKQSLKLNSTSAENQETSSFVERKRREKLAEEEGMEFTCALPVPVADSKSNVSLKTKEPFDDKKKIEMEKSSSVSKPLWDKNLKETGFLEKENVIETKSEQQTKLSLNRTVGVEGMEFTCVLPIETKIDSELDNIQLASKSIHFSNEKELINKIPVENQTPILFCEQEKENPQKIPNDLLLKGTEFTSVKQSLKLNSTSAENQETLSFVERTHREKLAEEEGMEFTCALPVPVAVSKSNLSLKMKEPFDHKRKTEMEVSSSVSKLLEDKNLKETELFLRENLIENESKSSLNKTVGVEEMDFSCVLPVQVADSKPNVSLKLKESFDCKRETEMEISNSVSKSLGDKNLKETELLEKENVIETESELQTKFSLNKTVGVEGMEFTCVLPVEAKIGSDLENVQLASKPIHFSNEKELITKIQVENQTPILFCEQEKENPQKIPNDLLLKGTEFTSVKQSLKLNSTSAENQEPSSFVERKRREKLAEEEGMEFTCALPVPVADSKSNVSLKMKEPFDEKRKTEMEKSSSVSKPLWDKNLKETGFLEKENVIETESEQQTKFSLNKTVGLEGMEFTCVLPVETKTDSELENVQLATKPIHFSNEKELINKIPVENQTSSLSCEQEKENPQKILNDSFPEEMEFTSVEHSLKLNSTSAENQETLSFIERELREKLAEPEGMNFTCVLPASNAISKPNVSLELKHMYDDKNETEFEITKSVSKSFKNKNLIETELHQREKVIETESDQQTKSSFNKTVGIEGMDFTCVVPVETKIDSELDKVPLTTKPTHFSNKNDLTSKTSIGDREEEKENLQKMHNNSLLKGMEFTSVKQSIKSKSTSTEIHETSSFIKKDQKDKFVKQEGMEFSCFESQNSAKLITNTNSESLNLKQQKSTLITDFTEAAIKSDKRSNIEIINNVLLQKGNTLNISPQKEPISCLQESKIDNIPAKRIQESQSIQEPEAISKNIPNYITKPFKEEQEINKGDISLSSKEKGKAEKSSNNSCSAFTSNENNSEPIRTQLAAFKAFNKEDKKPSSQEKENNAKTEISESSINKPYKSFTSTSNNVEKLADTIQNLQVFQESEPKPNEFKEDTTGKFKNFHYENQNKQKISPKSNFPNKENIPILTFDLTKEDEKETVFQRTSPQMEITDKENIYPALDTFERFQEEDKFIKVRKERAEPFQRTYIAESLQDCVLSEKESLGQTLSTTQNLKNNTFSTTKCNFNLTQTQHILSPPRLEITVPLEDNMRSLQIAPDVSFPEFSGITRLRDESHANNVTAKNFRSPEPKGKNICDLDFNSPLHKKIKLSEPKMLDQTDVNFEFTGLLSSTRCFQRFQKEDLRVSEKGLSDNVAYHQSSLEDTQHFINFNLTDKSLRDVQNFVSSEKDKVDVQGTCIVGGTKSMLSGLDEFKLDNIQDVSMPALEDDVSINLNKEEKEGQINLEKQQVDRTYVLNSVPRKIINLPVVEVNNDDETPRKNTKRMSNERGDGEIGKKYVAASFGVQNSSVLPKNNFTKTCKESNQWEDNLNSVLAKLATEMEMKSKTDICKSSVDIKPVEFKVNLDYDEEESKKRMDNIFKMWEDIKIELPNFEELQNRLLLHFKLSQEESTESKQLVQKTESLEEQVVKLSKMQRNNWKLINHGPNQYHVSVLRNIHIIFQSVEDKISKISLEDRFNSERDGFQIVLGKLAIQKLNPEQLKKSLGQNIHPISFLQYINLVIEELKEEFKEYQELSNRVLLKVSSNFRVQMQFFNPAVSLKVFVNFPDFKGFVSSEMVSIEFYKECIVSESVLKSLVKDTPSGFKFFNVFVDRVFNTIQQYRMKHDGILVV